MGVFPLWLVRTLITLLVVWLVWTLLVYPWIFSTQTFLRSHFWWMFPTP
jgi:hypothetical protein